MNAEWAESAMARACCFELLKAELERRVICAGAQTPPAKHPKDDRPYCVAGIGGVWRFFESTRTALRWPDSICDARAGAGR